MKLIIVKILPIMQDSIVSTLHFILNYLKSISTLYLTFFPISDNKARSCRFSLQTRLSYRGRTSSIYLKRCSALKEYKLLETSFQKKMWSCKEAVKHIEFFVCFCPTDAWSKFSGSSTRRRIGTIEQVATLISLNTGNHICTWFICNLLEIISRLQIHIKGYLKWQ